ncbi:O-antigen biosynthesis protein [Legionella lansingensis]|uniref:O-antigen biosynthesis protein n=1 Tax=Legionella lansingensis TaxID=45067 RepID=A0A0W0VLD1_9GAMM|nr:O-antigen ligase family protein [Legionella lansingensis]KTD20906.1 O-antigen biosynthesis protein [Legionella lansingensis]SNV44164.1 O-antigen biosynthesis protein [Legionella lansingensis]
MQTTQLLYHRFRDSLSLNTCIIVLLVALFFFIPVSLSLRAICFTGLLVPLFMNSSAQNTFRAIWSEPWCKALILFLLFILISCLWSPASSKEQYVILRKNLKYLSLPVLVAAFHLTRAQYPALFALLSGLLLVCLLSIAQYFGFYSNALHDPGAVFFNHIFTGFMMVYGAYLCAWLFLEKKNGHRLLWALFLSLFLFQIVYANTSRTAYVLMPLLMLFLALQYCNRKQFALGLVCCTLFLPVAFYTSPTLQEGVRAVKDDLKKYKKNEKDTNVGFRLQLHQYAESLIKKRPLIGNGAGSFSFRFYQDNPLPNLHANVVHPHGDYWLITTEQGFIGLGLFLMLLTILFFRSWYLPTLRIPALGILALMLIGNFSDSLMFNSATGYFILSVLGLCLSEEL